MKNLGEEFVWWYGVVEDRADPLELGRVRVRCYGWHTDDLKELPVENLPWAQPIQPITSAANSGIGRSATGLLEGTWVVGFFADGKEAQKPVIMGSLAGIPTEMSKNGFSDPKGNYPTLDSLFQPDTPRLARNGVIAESDVSLIAKRNNRLRDVPTATAPDIASLRKRYGTSDDNTYQKGAVGPTVGTDADYALDSEGEDTTPYWHEPNARYGGEGPQREEGSASSYPYNHVYRSESGHVFEVDDTPGIGRIHQYHNAGTFEEIQSDGTRVTKVVGKNYEVVISDENIYIQGTQNITVKGNAKLYIQGDHYTEVDGNQYVTVRGDRVTKIQGNDLKEVLTNESTQINGDKSERVTGNRRSTIDGNYTEIVGKNKNTTIKYNEAKTVQINSNLTVTGNTHIMSLKNIEFASAVNMRIANGGTFNHKSVGAANEEFVSTSSIKYVKKHVSDYNEDAHIRYDKAYYKHIGGDTYTWIADNFDDHTNATGPSGRTGINDTTNTTTDNL